MPSLTQIVPSYLNPHVETFINDNTIFQEVVSAPIEGVRLISTFTSSKGRDGVLLPFDLLNKYLDEYGNPNYKLFGQPGYMPYAALLSNQAKVWCMRVMPADAAYANIVVLAKVKVVVGVAPAITTMDIKHESVYIPNYTDKAEFSSLVDLLASTTPDADGYTTYPLFGAYVLGRGVYGNDLRIRLSTALQSDKDNGYKNFKIEVLDSVGGIRRMEAFTGSFYPDAVDSSATSVFLSDVVSDPDTGSTKLGIYVCEKSFDDLMTLYKTTVNTTTTTTISTLDVITGLDLAGVTIPSITFSTDVDSIALDNVEGLLLSGGDDGAFTYDLATLANRETAIDTAYTAAFNGETDPKILSKRQTPAELIFDACYSDIVKRALVSLIIKRYDAYGFIDAGIQNTQSAVISWGTSFATLGDRVFSKECQHYYIRDAFTGKSIPMTTTYFLAGQLPVHFKTIGNQVPFAGESFGTLVGGIRGTLKPIVDADDNITKDALYTARINYFECIAENTFVRGTQGTSQLVWSDLSEESNMHVLLEMKRLVETMTSSKRYKFSEAEDRKNFTEAADRTLSVYRGKKCRDVQIYFDMTAWEEERSIIHCYLSITFRTIAKRGIVEIDINKRV